MDQPSFVRRIFSYFRRGHGQVALFAIACRSVDPIELIPGQVIVSATPHYMIFDRERFTPAGGVAVRLHPAPQGCALIHADRIYKRMEDAFPYFRQCLTPIPGVQDAWPERVEFFHAGTAMVGE